MAKQIDKDHNRWDSAPTVVYIAGRGYSGSTILDILLGNAPGVTSVGELLGGFSGIRSCACGSEFRSCHFWERVRLKFGKEAKDRGWKRLLETSSQFGNVRKFPRIAMVKGELEGDLAEYRKLTVVLFRAISQVSETSIIVESSKEVTRAAFLANCYSDTRILHLVKNPLGVLASYRWRLESGDAFQLLRHRVENIWIIWPFILFSALTWSIGNVLVEFIRWRNPRKVLRIRYEDLCRRPEDTLETIGQFTGIDVEPVVEKIHGKNIFQAGHNVAGNRITQSKSLSFEPSMDYDALGWIVRGIALLVTYPLRKVYGY